MRADFLNFLVLIRVSLEDSMDLKPSTEGQREVGTLGVEVRGMRWAQAPVERWEKEREECVDKEALRGQKTPRKT